MFYMYFLSIQNNKYHYIWCKLIHLQDCAYEVTRLIPSLNDHLAFIIKTPIPPMKYIQDMFHVTWLSALQNGSDFCVSTEMSLSQQSIYKMPLLYTSTFVYNIMKILKWAVISTSMSIIPCLNSMLHVFTEA